MNAFTRKLLSLLGIIIFSLTLTACKQENNLDISTYCKSTVNYVLSDDKKTDGTFDLSTINSSFCEQKQYSKIQITTNRYWTYGLEIDRIEFDILLSASADVDIDITVSNLENGAHLDEEKNTYYYHKTLAINKETTTVKLDIDDVFNDKDSVITIQIDKACYTTNPELTISIGNLKMYGQHTQVNY